jgi:4-hydroxy-3-methylbut-2-enyl diphosphate reductase
MNIIKAEHLGMCFGVRDAIALARKASHAGPLTILGELVHNETVLDELRGRGIQIARTLEDAETRELMITAHGAARSEMNSARQQGFHVLEATCPLVKSAHRALTSLVQAGFHPVIVGKRDHVEVRGMTGDLQHFDVVLTGADVFELEPRPRYGVVAQTTQPIERVEYLTGLLRWRFPGSELRLIDTVCQPTKQRQRAAVEIASQSDVVIVVGGEHSNNTRELVSSCRRYCGRVHHIQCAAELEPAWLAGASTIGLTAGTSTPDEIVDEVEQRLRQVAVEIGWMEEEEVENVGKLVAGDR